MTSFVVYVVWRVILITLLAIVLLLAYRRYGDTIQHRQNVAQFMGGLVIVLVLYYLSLMALRQDSLVQDTNVNVRVLQRTMILSGFIEVPIITDTVYETLDPRAASFVALPRSFNRQGGAQFSYQFWLFLDDVLTSTIANTMILMRGDPKTYSWNDSSGNVMGPAVAIACPSISFGASFDEIKIGFNTLSQVMNTYTTKAIGEPLDPNSRRDLLGLMSSKWVLFTVVFEDNVPVSEFEDGVMLRFYVNDVLYDHASYPGQTLRQNNGELILFPTLDGTSGSVNKARIADVSYYNYAVDADSISQVFATGPPTTRASILGKDESQGEPLYLSEYNKLGLYTA